MLTSSFGVRHRLGRLRVAQRRSVERAQQHLLARRRRRLRRCAQRRRRSSSSRPHLNPQPTGVAIGGDRFPGSTFSDHLFRFQADPNVKLMVLLGEVGGDEECVVVVVVWRLSSSVLSQSLGTRSPTRCATAASRSRSWPGASAPVLASFPYVRMFLATYCFVSIFCSTKQQYEVQFGHAGALALGRRQVSAARAPSPPAVTRLPRRPKPRTST